MADVTFYQFDNGYTARRETKNVLYKGNSVAPSGRWVLRDKDNRVIDIDRYRNDMFDRYDLKIVSTR